jgi:ABC-type Fe3+-siderophore transport system permease subunit
VQNQTMNDIHTFVLQHVAAWLPGLWNYSRPADLLVVILAMVIFVAAIRLVVKLFRVLLLGAILILAYGHHLPHLGFIR